MQMYITGFSLRYLYWYIVLLSWWSVLLH